MFFRQYKNRWKIKKIVSFQGREMVYNKNSIVSSIGKNRKFPEKHQRFAFSILSELGRFAIIIGL